MFEAPFSSSEAGQGSHLDVFHCLLGTLKVPRRPRAQKAYLAATRSRASLWSPDALRHFSEQLSQPRLRLGRTSQPFGNTQSFKVSSEFGKPPCCRVGLWRSDVQDTFRSSRGRQGSHSDAFRDLLGTLKVPRPPPSLKSLPNCHSTVSSPLEARCS